MGVRGVLSRESLGALILALAIPLLFLDEEHQPGFGLDIGSADIEINPKDVAAVVVLLAAIVALVRHGGRLRLSAARIVWIPGLALLAWLGFQALRPATLDDPPFDEHFAGYLELVEYALLAVAVPLLVRRALDLSIVVAGIVLWSFVATGVAVAQLLGVGILDAGGSGERQPSFLTVHDLAGLSALSLGFAAAGVIATRRRIPAPLFFPLAVLGGAVGMMLAGSLAAVAGFAVGAILAMVAAKGRLAPAGPRNPSLLALAALVVVVAVGTTAVRAGWIERALERAGISEEASAEEAPTVPREVLVYIALRAFQEHPVLGVGWQRSGSFPVVEEWVDDARERYPDEPAEAFPSIDRNIDVPSLYAQLLADAGAIGLVLLIVLGAGGLVLCWRTAAYASVPWAAGAGLAMMCSLLALAGEWSLAGLIPGVPLQAATALTLGLAAAGAATVEDESGG